RSFLSSSLLKFLLKSIEYKMAFRRILSDKEKGQNPLFTRYFGLFCPSLDWINGGGGGSRTPVRERSAQSVYRFSPGTFSPRTTPPDGRPSVSPPKLLACVPAGADACQPDGFDTLPGYQASPGSA